MNGSAAMAESLVAAVLAGAPADVDLLFCPPMPYLSLVAGQLRGAAPALGAQDCCEHASGAFTGETAAPMLRDVGCSHVIVGHSERRQFFGDTDERVIAKLLAARAAGLTPVLCVGETLAERKADATERALTRQLAPLLEHDDAAALLGAIVVAYEPVWAIGTGESASPEQAQAVHAWIRGRVADHDTGAAATLRILYGGSVKPDNAAALFAQPDIDGGLIGGASLDATAFLAIARAAA